MSVRERFTIGNVMSAIWMLAQALSLRSYRSQGLIDPCPHVSQAMQGHFNGSPGAGGLEEIPGAPSHNMVRSDAEGYGQASIDTMDTGAGPPVVGTDATALKGYAG